jgi:4'-phosphopantetheinyl transferase
MRSSTASQWESLAAVAHVWHIDPEAVPNELLERGRGWLTPAEREHCGRLASDSLRHAYLVTRMLCRTTLSRYTDVDPASWLFSINSNGKPFIVAPVAFASLRFNLTHTQGLLACIVSRVGDVGVDVEGTTRQIDISQIARHFLSASESDRLFALAPERRAARLFEYWVLKEAYLKGCGIGLSQPPEEITIELNANGQPHALEGWQLGLHYPTPSHVAATAVRMDQGATPVPVVWRSAAFLHGNEIL